MRNSELDKIIERALVQVAKRARYLIPVSQISN